MCSLRYSSELRYTKGTRLLECESIAKGQKGRTKSRDYSDNESLPPSTHPLSHDLSVNFFRSYLFFFFLLVIFPTDHKPGRPAGQHRLRFFMLWSSHNGILSRVYSLPVCFYSILLHFLFLFFHFIHFSSSSLRRIFIIRELSDPSPGEIYLVQHGGSLT